MDFNALILLPIIFGTFTIIYARFQFENGKIYDNKLGIGLLLYVFIFSILANVFYYHPDFQSSIHAGSGETYISGALYFCLAYLILLYPFIKGHFSGFESISISPNLQFFLLIIALSSLFEAALLLPKAISGFGHISIDIREFRDDVQTNKENIGNGISSIPVLIYSYFRTLLPLALFYFIAFEDNKKKAGIFFLATFITPFLRTLSTGTREHMVFPLIEITLSYLIFYPYLEGKIKRNINVSLAAIGSIILILAVWMSYQRFNHDVRFDSSFWTIKYVGEGFVNFNTLLYDNLQEPMWGNFNLPFFRDLLMLDDFENDAARRAYVAANTKFNTTLFYTLIGALIVDWGKIGGLLFAIVISKLCYNFTKIENDSIQFSQLILLHFFASICAKGVFYFNYRSDFGGRTILIIIILCLFLKSQRSE